jgi:hypothetical protein
VLFTAHIASLPTSERLTGSKVAHIIHLGDVSGLQTRGIAHVVVMSFFFSFPFPLPFIHPSLTFLTQTTAELSGLATAATLSDVSVLISLKK